MGPSQATNTGHWDRKRNSLELTGEHGAGYLRLTKTVLIQSKSAWKTTKTCVPVRDETLEVRSTHTRMNTSYSQADTHLSLSSSTDILQLIWLAQSSVSLDAYFYTKYKAN